MTGARASATLRVGDGSAARSWATSLALGGSVGITILAGAILLLMLPAYMHPALEAAGAPALLGVTSGDARALSDRTVGELLLGPGTFAFAGPDGRPFYGADEAGHLRDVRVVLYAFLGLAGISMAVLVAAVTRGWRRPAVWRAIARGGAVLGLLIVVLGAFALVAFNVAFELFHRIFFPAGNWAFDPQTQRLVQLYPLAFWQITAAALAALSLAGAGVVWLVARRRAESLATRR